MGQGALVRQNYSVKPEPSSTGEKAPSFCSMDVLKKISLERPLPKPPISSPKPVIEVTEKTVKSISIAQKSPMSNQSSPKAEAQKFPPQELFCEKIWRGQEECKEDEGLRKAFIGYIRSFDWTSKVSMDIQDQLSRRRPTQDLQEIAFNDYSVRSRTSSSDSKDMEAVAATMMKCTQLKIRDTMDGVPKPNRRKLSVIETCFNTEELRDILVTTLWPLFLSSEAFQHFLHNPEEPFILYEGDESPSAPNFRCSESEKARQMKEVYLQTAQTVSDEYLNKILIEGRWADKVLSYLEKAPFSFSISSADREAKGFPIVYVNGAFESTTRYERSEVIGRGHGFLRSPNTEEDQLMKIADALSKGEGCKIAITNRRKNGVDFLNFLALRPVLSRDSGDYKYVIAVQYDITNAEASLRQMKMVNDFLSLVGNILKA